jgi:colanic acid/amylovoran biosynthesis glycosyltransferase
MTSKIAYFVNQYPKVSHTFIRREILALERQGLSVQRIALLGWAEQVPDREDLEEQAKTRYVLRQGAWGLIGPLFVRALAAPMRWLSAIRLAIQVSRRSDHRIVRHLVRVAEACRVLNWLRAGEAARLHAHFGTNSAEVAMYVHRLGGPPVSYTVHGPEEFETALCLEEKVREASFVAAISSYCRSQIYLRCRPEDWHKVQVVRCGIDHSFQSEIEAPDAPRFVCVGRLSAQKGQLLLIEAAARLRARGVVFELVLAGDGPERGLIEAAIRRNGLGEVVRITGWISSDQVRAEIVAARALVLPSFAEGLPVVIMEALALRRPVLSTYVAGIPELVAGGETGWLFPAGSLEAIVDAMQDCLARPLEAIRRMGEEGRRRVLVQHSVDVEASKLAELFQRPG